MTNQEIFDKVFNHAKTQRKEFGNDAQSGSGSIDGCLYRCKLSDGRVKMCFIGVLIPDEDYDQSMEGDSVQNLFDKHPDMMESIGLSQSQHSLLQELQYIHDENEPNKWEQAFAALAESNDLECSVEILF